MDEYEKLEEELQKVYNIYLVKFRNLDFLENQLDIRNKADSTRQEVNSLRYSF